MFIRLKNKAISNGDYKHAQRVYLTQKMKSLGWDSERSSIHDIMQLIEIGEIFAVNVHGKFKLDLSTLVTLL